jgi:hypothetical protein
MAGYAIANPPASLCDFANFFGRLPSPQKRQTTALRALPESCGLRQSLLYCRNIVDKMVGMNATRWSRGTSITEIVAPTVPSSP